MGDSSFLPSLFPNCVCWCPFPVNFWCCWIPVFWRTWSDWLFDLHNPVRHPCYSVNWSKCEISGEWGHQSPLIKLDPRWCRLVLHSRLSQRSLRRRYLHLLLVKIKMPKLPLFSSQNCNQYLLSKITCGGCNLRAKTGNNISVISTLISELFLS